MKQLAIIPYLVDQQASAELQIFITNQYYQGIWINDTVNSHDNLKLSRSQVIALIAVLNSALLDSTLITPGPNTEHPGYVIPT